MSVSLALPSLPLPGPFCGVVVDMDGLLVHTERQWLEAKTILFGLTGTGYFDMSAYMQYQAGTMVDYELTDDELNYYFDTLPQLPADMA